MALGKSKEDYLKAIFILQIKSSSAEKLEEPKSKPHYMESTDDRLDLRHGLGFLLVRQIIEAHHGTIEIERFFPSQHQGKRIRPFHGCDFLPTWQENQQYSY